MGYVYLIQEDHDNLFKIGKTINGVELRLAELQVGNSSELRIFGRIAVDDIKKLEGELHDRFDKYRVRGEWFCVEPKVIVDLLEEFHGELCVDDPFRIRVSFDKEAYRAEIESNLRRTFEAQHAAEINKLKRSLRFKEKLLEWLRTRLPNVVKYIGVALIILATGWLIFTGAGAYNKAQDASSAKAIAELDESKSKMKIMDSLNHAEEWGKVTKAAAMLDSANTLLNSLEKNPKANAFKIFRLKIYTIPSLDDDHDFYLGLACKSYAESKDTTGSPFNTYEFWNDDSANCVYSLKVYADFKRNDLDRYNSINGDTNVKIINERLKRVRQKIREMDCQYPEFWLMTSWHKP